jgi:large subunit ribosomal protein L21e
MPHSFGLRARTRTLFQRPFRHHGAPALGTYMKKYKLGEYVDIKVNSAIHKGMPFRYYHGKTGKIWNISKRAIGVIVNKRVNTRIIPKV